MEDLQQPIDTEVTPDVVPVEGGASEGTMDAPGREIPADAGTPAEMNVEENAADILNEGEEAPEESAEGEESAQEGATLLAMASELFPDREFATEEEAIQAVDEYIKASKEYEQKTKESNQQLITLFNEHPPLVQLIRMMHQGADLVSALPHVVDVDKLVPPEGDPDWERWNQAKEEGAKSRAEIDKARQEVSQNLEMSMQDIDAFATENEMSPEEATEFLSEIDKILENVSQGKITKDILGKLKQGLFHDKIVSEETEKAEIRGRNEAIEEKIQKEETKKGDGLPEVKSTKTEPDQSEVSNDPASTLGRGIDEYASQRRRF